MQIELRKIDGQDFIVQRNGKREYIRSPADAVGIENSNIAAAGQSSADTVANLAQLSAADVN